MRSEILDRDKKHEREEVTARARGVPPAAAIVLLLKLSAQELFSRLGAANQNGAKRHALSISIRAIRAVDLTSGLS